VSLRKAQITRRPLDCVFDNSLNVKSTLALNFDSGSVCVFVAEFKL
jgi:hypothetical protein